jgi:putative transposase
VTFTRALISDGKEDLLNQHLLDELAHGVVPDNDDLLPAAGDLGQRTADDLQSDRGVHGRHPHRPALRAAEHAELDRLRAFYNGTRLHEGIGYVTPDDEHEG